MPEQFGEKQHDATPHRRQQAREKGQVVKSQDLASAVMLLGGVAALYFFGADFFRFLTAYTRLQLENDAWLSTDSETIVAHWWGLFREVSRAMWPILGLIFLVAVVSQLGQVGFLFLPQKLAFDLSRLDPLKGVQRLFSMTNAVSLGFGIFKVLIVGGVAVAALWSDRTSVLTLSSLNVVEIWSYLIQIMLSTLVKVGLALLILAILDYAYQWWKQEQDLKMTTQEVRDELKQVQGDPQVAARRRAVQRQLVLNRIGTAVPKSDVVVTNPTELSIAIQYEHESMDAPIIVAKGAGVIAQRIRRLALENGVPIVERKELARALYGQVDVGKPIPPDQYAAMAEVLKYVYQLKGKTLPQMDAA